MDCTENPELGVTVGPTVHRCHRVRSYQISLFQVWTVGLPALPRCQQWCLPILSSEFSHRVFLTGRYSLITNAPGSFIFTLSRTDTQQQNCSLLPFLRSSSLCPVQTRRNRTAVSFRSFVHLHFVPYRHAVTELLSPSVPSLRACAVSRDNRTVVVVLLNVLGCRLTY